MTDREDRLMQLHVMAQNIRDWSLDYQLDFGVDMDAPYKLADQLMCELGTMVTECDETATTAVEKSTGFEMSDKEPDDDE